MKMITQWLIVKADTGHVYERTTGDYAAILAKAKSKNTYGAGVQVFQLVATVDPQGVETREAVA